MKLDELELPGATYKATPSKKVTLIEYAKCDENYVEESGRGITSLAVMGRATTLDQRDDIEAACVAIGEKKLKFPSQGSTSDDRYYKVKTLSPTWAPVEDSADMYDYAFTAYAADPRQFYTATDLPVA